MRHTFSALVQNHPGVLMRVAALFGRRGYNIESLAVGVTENPAFSRITVVTEGDDRALEQVTKQLAKLINVVRVSDLTGGDSVDRELALVKVNAESSRRPAIVQVADIFRAKIVDVGKSSMIIETTGDEDKIDAMLALLSDFGILEVVRTGKIALARGTWSLIDDAQTQQTKGDDNNGESVLRPGRRYRTVSG
jgi:acetolactate synthase-1/3 small subunit